jgi:SEC-C motif-containing protein
MGAELCSCGSGKREDDCCGPILAGTAGARTPEELMRARFTAHCRREYAFLVESTHPAQRKGMTAESIDKWARHVQWTRLEILSAGLDDAGDRGRVSFCAEYVIREIPRTLREDAEFLRENGVWFYVDGKVHGAEPYQRETPRVGRNDPCPCGSGEKYKKCCGR